jgi:protein-disulfide isomerase
MDNQENNKFLVPLSIVLAGVMISGAIYMGGKGSVANVNTAANRPQQPAGEVAPVDTEDHIVGDINAPIVIVEYSDTECPFCKVFHNTMKEVVRSYDGKVAWVYRHFPIEQLHDRAPYEAEATECAAELGGNAGFWNYINQVFDQTHSNDSLDPAELPKIATKVGLDTTAFTNCLESHKYKEFIDQSIEEAIKAGAKGTPYSVIITRSGKQVTINGAESLTTVKAKIDALLK